MSCLGRLMAVLVAAVALLVASSGTALADCTGESPGTPQRWAVRKIVFSGVIVAETTVPSEDGPPGDWDAYRMKVERVYRGNVEERIDLVPLCAPITLEVGEQYIVGNAGYARRGEWQMLNDRSSIAWRMLPGDAVELQDFGVPVHRYPDHYQAPQTVDDVLDFLVPDRLGALPDTATGADGETGTTDTAPMLALAAGLLAFGFATRGRIARRTLQRTSS